MDLKLSVGRLSPCGISDQEGYGKIFSRAGRSQSSESVSALFEIFKFLAVGVKADRLKPVRNDFQSVYFFIERRGETFYMLEPWNKRKYVWPSRLRGIDAFHSVLSANFVAILLSPNFARRRASNLCVLYNTVYTK